MRVRQRSSQVWMCADIAANQHVAVWRTELRYLDSAEKTSVKPLQISRDETFKQESPLDGGLSCTSESLLVGTSNDAQCDYLGGVAGAGAAGGFEKSTVGATSDPAGAS